MTDAAAGWFPDVNQPGRLRWWDGTAWTDHYHDQPPAFPAPMAGTAPTPRTGRRPGPPLAISIAMIVVGFLVTMAAGISVVLPFVRIVTSAKTLTVPGSTRLHLSSGEYVIFEATGTTDERGGYGRSIDTGSVRITGADGTAVAVSRAGGATETITRDDQDYTGAVEFKLPKTADYDFEIRGDAPGGALVGRSPTDVLRRAVPWMVIGGLGVLIGVAGIVLTIVGSIRRYHWKQGR